MVATESGVGTGETTTNRGGLKTTLLTKKTIGEAQGKHAKNAKTPITFRGWSSATQRKKSPQKKKKTKKNSWKGKVRWGATTRRTSLKEATENQWPVQGKRKNVLPSGKKAELGGGEKSSGGTPQRLRRPGGEGDLKPKGAIHRKKGDV